MAQNTAFPQRSLGASGIETSAIGFGCMSLSGTYGTSNDDEAVALIHEVLDQGITMLDTSDMYGPFTNEVLVGRALAAAARAGMPSEMSSASV